jgi:hypothetical protein
VEGSRLHRRRLKTSGASLSPSFSLSHRYSARTSASYWSGEGPTSTRRVAGSHSSAFTPPRTSGTTYQVHWPSSRPIELVRAEVGPRTAGSCLDRAAYRRGYEELGTQRPEARTPHGTAIPAATASFPPSHRRRSRGSSFPKAFPAGAPLRQPTAHRARLVHIVGSFRNVDGC